MTARWYLAQTPVLNTLGTAGLTFPTLIKSTDAVYLSFVPSFRIALER